MAVQDTIDAADEVAVILNAGTYTEALTFARSFIPDFDPDELPDTLPKCVVFPASLELTRASRRDDNEDSVIEVGIGRKLSSAATEDAAIVAQLLAVEEVKNELRDESNQTIAGKTDLDEFHFTGLTVNLFVPELLRKRIALSVIRVVYRLA